MAKKQFNELKNDPALFLKLRNTLDKDTLLLVLDYYHEDVDEEFNKIFKEYVSINTPNFFQSFLNNMPFEDNLKLIKVRGSLINFIGYTLSEEEVFYLLENKDEIGLSNSNVYKLSSRISKISKVKLLEKAKTTPFLYRFIKLDESLKKNIIESSLKENNLEIFLHIENIPFEYFEKVISFDIESVKFINVPKHNSDLVEMVKKYPDSIKYLNLEDESLYEIINNDNDMFTKLGRNQLTYSFVNKLKQEDKLKYFIRIFLSDFKNSGLKNNLEDGSSLSNSSTDFNFYYEHFFNLFSFDNRVAEEFFGLYDYLSDKNKKHFSSKALKGIKRTPNMIKFVSVEFVKNNLEEVLEIGHISSLSSKSLKRLVNIITDNKLIDYGNNRYRTIVRRLIGSNPKYIKTNDFNDDDLKRKAIRNNPFLKDFLNKTSKKYTKKTYISSKNITN